MTKRSCRHPDGFRVLGLDPGSRVTGWGLVEGDRRTVRALALGCLHPPRGVGRAALLAALAGEAEELLGRSEPDAVALETPFAGRFPRAALGLSEVRGALLAVLGRWGGEVVEIEPALVKSMVVGSGQAEKRQVAFVVQHELGLATAPSADAADALALAWCCLRRLDVDL